MYTFTLESAQPTVTPWGREVQHRLREQDLTQDVLCAAMRTKGYEIDKVLLCHLLRGRRIKSRLPLILAINDYLGIPYDHSTTEGGEGEDGKSNKGAE